MVASCSVHRRYCNQGTSLNPLHCGAVVASTRTCRACACRLYVSIPFIAGQWSLQPPHAKGGNEHGEVSIPFIAGQWSLQIRNPRGSRVEIRVSIPFIAGQWSLRAGAAGASGARLVSIPFIAGQWSLRDGRPAGRPRRRTSQSPSLRGSGRFRSVAPARGEIGPRLNPLHCGAVVASSSASGTFWRRIRSLNPLHCGAVVASQLWRWLSPRPAGVSIPFIAGQWSLHKLPASG